MQLLTPKLNQFQLMSRLPNSVQSTEISMRSVFPKFNMKWRSSTQKNNQ